MLEYVPVVLINHFPTLVQHGLSPSVHVALQPPPSVPTSACCKAEISPCKAFSLKPLFAPGFFSPPNYGKVNKKAGSKKVVWRPTQSLEKQKPNLVLFPG